jgi:biotin carboxyl carrier protein
MTDPKIIYRGLIERFDALEIDETMLKSIELFYDMDGRLTKAAFEGKVYHLDMGPSSENYEEVIVDGRAFAVTLKRPVDLITDALGFDKRQNINSNIVFAPMPGNVLKIDVSEGQIVEEGSPLLTLEAMKMENVVLAPMHGSIGRIHVKEGQKVTKKEPLVDME